MAVRRVVQDSDDEDDSERDPPSAAKVLHLRSGSTIDNLESSSAAHSSVRSAGRSTGSTGERIYVPLQISLLTCEAEALTREILNAQKSLLDLTPSGKTSDAIVTQPIITTQSPTMSKLKRRQTTGDTPDSNKKRGMKTYGAKASKDDFDFHGSSDEGGDIVSRKRQKHENGSIGHVISKGRHETESYSLGNSASNDPLHERQDAGLEHDTTAEADNDTIITAASRAKKGRAMSLSVIREAHEVTTGTQTTCQGVRDTGAEILTGGNEIPSGESATKKKRSRRRLTTHDSSSAAQHDASMVHPGVMSGGGPSSTTLETTASDMGGLSRASPDVLSLRLDEPCVQSISPSTSTEMLPPLVKHVLAVPPNSNYSCPSTVPNTTPNEPSQADTKASRDRSHPKPPSWSSSARMRSPTIPGNSTPEFESTSVYSVIANAEGQTKPLEGSGNIQMLEEVILINSALRQSPPPNSQSQPPVLRATDPRSAHGPVPEVKEELSKPSATDEGCGRNSQPPKGKLRRKTKDDVHTDELGADDIAVGLPKEQYQPRPSRSRANRADEDFLLAVDFSKRPEAVVKAKIKRRKTTGGHIPTRKEVTLEKISEVCDDEPMALGKKKNRRMTATDDHKPSQGVADIVDLPEHDANRTEMHGEANATSLPTGESQLEGIVDVVDDNKGNDVDETANPVPNTEEPKRKRGRPRKKTTEELPSLPDPSANSPITAPAANTEKPTKPAPAKKPARRRKTDDITTTPQVSAEFVVSNNNEEHHHGADDNANHDAAPNSEPLPPASPPRLPNPPAPVQTPQKAPPRGPDKHSPLNSGKVPYRVGLSRRARIEPLLRIVRK